MRIETKQLRMYGLALLILVSGISIESYGQRGERLNRQVLERNRDSLKIQHRLSEDQLAQVKDIQTNHQTENRKISAQLNEKKAHLKVLLIAEQRDNKAVGETIDEIAGLQATKMKLGINHRDEMGKVISPEQMRFMNNRQVRGQGFMQHRGNKDYPITRQGRRNNHGREFGHERFGRPNQRGPEREFERSKNKTIRFRR